MRERDIFEEAVPPHSAENIRFDNSVPILYSTTASEYVSRNVATRTGQLSKSLEILAVVEVDVDNQS
jgi:hypothetical protein